MNRKRSLAVITLFLLLFTLLLTGCQAREAVVAALNENGGSEAGSATVARPQVANRPSEGRAAPASEPAVPDNDVPLAERIRFHDALAEERAVSANRAPARDAGPTLADRIRFHDRLSRSQAPAEDSDIDVEAPATLAHYLQLRARLWKACMQQPFCIGTLETCTFSCVSPLPGAD